MNIKFNVSNVIANNELIVNIVAYSNGITLCERKIDLSSKIDNIFLDFSDAEFNKHCKIIVDFTTVDNNTSLIINDVLLDNFYSSNNITFLGCNVETDEKYCNVLGSAGTLRYEFKFPFMDNIF